MKLKNLETITFHDVFAVTIILKGLNGVIEILTAIASIFITPNRFSWIIERITASELSEDPTDWLVRLLLNQAESYTSTSQIYLVAFLLVHGITKIILVYFLLKRKIRVYPIAIGIFTVFTVFQAGAFIENPGILSLTLLILDGLIAVLATIEYKHLKKHLDAGTLIEEVIQQ